MPVLLRRATAADIAPLNALIDASVRQLAVGYYSPAQIESAMRYMFGVDSQLVTDGTYFLIEVDGTLAACGGWSGRQTLFGGDQHKAAAPMASAPKHHHHHHGDADAPVDPATVPARIRAFFVHPQFARRGLARQLYEHCAAEARAAGFVALELMGTLPGVPLYRTLGFETVEAVPVVLPDGVVVPCERMRRALD
jgi:GNAT superfamily N-acetyltransferase